MSEAAVSVKVENLREPPDSQEHHNHPVEDFVFNAVSVEPLHFLGIAPSAEKAALLSACKSIHLLTVQKRSKLTTITS